MPRSIHRSRRIVAIVAIVTAWILASAPIAAAGNATGISTILPKAGIIKGKVVGKDTGTGIVGAWVSASATTYPASSGGAETTAGGAFVIRGLTAGKTYKVSVSPDDDAHYGGYWTNNTDHFTTDYFTAAATPTATTAGRDIGTIRVPKGYTLSGTVRGGTVASNVVLAGIDVELEGDEYDYATTGADGKFYFKGLPPGTYNLSYDVPSTKNYKDGVYKTNGGSNWAKPGSVPTDIVITTANKGANVILPTGRTVTGHVKNSAGVGQQYAYVRISGTNGSESVSTDATGKYVIKGVADGTDYEISVDAPYPQTLMSGYFRSGATGNFTPNEAQASAFVVNGNETVADIKLPLGYTITGQLFLPNGTSPAVGAPVTASGPVYEYATTGSDGKFTIRGLTPGNYTVRASPPYASPPVNAYGGWVDAATATHRLTTDSAAADTFTLSSTVKTKSTGKLVLWTGWTIAGTVKGGTPTSNVVLKGVYVWASGPGYGYTTTNASGIYKVVGLAPGKYRVDFSPPSPEVYEAGYYKSGAAPNFTRDYSLATLVCVGPVVPCP